MCYQFRIEYEACGHHSQPEYRPCGSPSCTKVTLVLSVDEILDFCPECFLMDIADFRQYVERPYTYEVYRIMRITSRWHPTRNQAKEMYARAEKYYEATSGANDILALVNPDGTTLNYTQNSVILHMLRMLMRHFWARIKYDISPQPTLRERMLILQLIKVRDQGFIYFNLKEFQSKADQIHSLTTIVPEEDVAENYYCNICHEALGTPTEDGKIEHCVKTISCNHMFGNLCLAAWLTKNDDEWSCPICRGILTPNAQPEVQEEPDTQNNHQVKFTNWCGKIVRIDKAQTPEWMIALLDATDVAEGDEGEDYDDEEEEEYEEDNGGNASNSEEDAFNTRLRHTVVDMERRFGFHFEFDYRLRAPQPPPRLWTRVVNLLPTRIREAFR